MASAGIIKSSTTGKFVKENSRSGRAELKRRG